MMVSNESSPSNENVVFKEIATAVRDLDRELALEIVQKGLDQGIDPVKLLQSGVMAGLQLIGARFESEEYFLPELILGGQVSKACIALLKPHLPDSATTKLGTIVMGATKGDLHDIGMNLVITQLQIAGFEVHTLGTDVPSMTFIDKAQELNADIIGLSAFINSTIPCFVDVINYLRDMGLRDKYKVIVGGGSTTQAHADSIGADGWAPDAMEAVKMVKKIMGISNAEEAAS